MSGIDWSKSKDNTIGAFVRNMDGEIFFVDTKEDHFGLGNKGFVGLSCGREYHVFAHIWTWHDRPSSPEWNGEGLPPAGVVCRAEWCGSHQGDVTVLFMGDDFAVLRNHGHGKEQCAPVGEYKFRPLRTQAQIEADERESAIIDACESVEEKISKYNTRLDCSVAIRATVEAMIDAGYRKQPAKQDGE